MSVPCWSVDEVASVCEEHYGLIGTITDLVSYADQNFLVETTSGRFVFKVANLQEPRAQLEAQHLVLSHLGQHAHGIAVPKVIPNHQGQEITEIVRPNGRYLCRLVSFIEGKFVGDLPTRPSPLIRGIGLLYGRINRALRSFDHASVPSRYLKWDLQRASDARPNLKWIDDAHRRSMATRFLDEFEEKVLADLSRLRHTLVHNDGNDYNILVRMEGDQWLPFGVIDFGDMVYGPTVFDLAITAAYSLMGLDDPLTGLCDLVSAFHEVFPLTAHELEALYPAICARLAVSVCYSAANRKEHPDNEYLLVSEQPAWQLMFHLASMQPIWVLMKLRSACGFEPHPNHAQARMALQRADIHPAIELGNAVPIDLGPNTTIPGDMNQAMEHMQSLIATTGPVVGYGGYLELRSCYNAPQFMSESGTRRTVHLGIDVFAVPGTKISAPLASEVHGVFDHAVEGDYGPTVVLKHLLEGVTCYTLYGHLGRSVLSLKRGQSLARGEVFAEIGDSSINGGWPPHLHLQLYLDTLGQTTDLPGTSTPAEKQLWASICPDPSRLIGLACEDDTESLLNIRKNVVGPSLSLSYRRPLHLTRGQLQHLYTASGDVYLDAVNNVPHVGHNHPRVVEATCRQVRELNTNTRYLHRNLTDFAEALLATAPDPIQVCYIVNSGSEANDLALRLARTATGRNQTVVIEGAYHGNLTSLVAISPYKYKGKGGGGKPDWVIELPLPDPKRGLFQGPDAARRYVDQLDRLLDGCAPAAVIAEPVMGCGGQLPLPQGYLAQLFNLIRRRGGVCIADEVQIGLGRLGSHFWGFQAHDALPDIITIGKPLGNGHPVAAVMTTRDIAEQFDNGMEYFNTFGGNPVSCAIGLEVLAIIEQEQLQNHARIVGEGLKRQIQAIDDPRIGDVRGSGLFLGVELINPDTQRPDGALAAELVEHLKCRFVLISRDGPDHNVLKIKPPLCFDREDARLLSSTLRSGLAVL